MPAPLIAAATRVAGSAATQAAKKTGATGIRNATKVTGPKRSPLQKTRPRAANDNIPRAANDNMAPHTEMHRQAAMHDIVSDSLEDAYERPAPRPNARPAHQPGYIEEVQEGASDMIETTTSNLKNNAASKILFWVLGFLATPQMYLALASVPSIGFELMGKSALISLITSQSLVLGALTYWFGWDTIPDGTLFLLLSYLVIAIGWFSLIIACVVLTGFRIHWTNTWQLFMFLVAFILYVPPLINAAPWAIVWVWLITTFPSKSVHS